VEDVEIVGSSSDHIILNSKGHKFRVGDEVRFYLNYGALLGAATSPYVEKVYLNSQT
jgi:predicted amino acid racemase